MDTVPHNAHVYQMRIGRHERIYAGIVAGFIKDTRADICTCFSIKGILEMISTVIYNVLQFGNLLITL